MNKTFKYLALVLALIIVLSLLVACGGEQDNGASDQGNHENVDPGSNDTTSGGGNGEGGNGDNGVGNNNGNNIDLPKIPV